MAGLQMPHGPYVVTHHTAPDAAQAVVPGYTGPQRGHREPSPRSRGERLGAAAGRKGGRIATPGQLAASTRRKSFSSTPRHRLRPRCLPDSGSRW